MPENRSDFQHTFATPTPIRLRLQSEAGRVTLRALDTTETTVSLQALNDAGEEAVHQARVEQDGDTVRVDVRRRGGSMLRMGKSQVAIEITLPTGSRLDVATESSHITAEGEYAAAACSTGSGGIDLDTVTGDATFKTGSGEVSAGQVTGRLQAATGSGDVRVEQTGSRTQISVGSGEISLGQTGGDVQAKSASGNVDVGSLGGDLSAKTASGDVTVRRVTQGHVSAKTASGDVAVGIADGTAAWLDLDTVSGRIDQELTDTEAPREDQPRVEVTARTASGDVRIHRV